MRPPILTICICLYGIFNFACKEIQETRFTSIIHTDIRSQNFKELRFLNQQAHSLEQYSAFELLLLQYGFIPICELNKNICVDLRYTSSNNHWGIPLYTGLSKAFLYKDAAQKLNTAQNILSVIDSAYTLVVFDAVRPHSVQKDMWDLSPLPNHRKRNFIALPEHTSLHNYGAAVDVSIKYNDEMLDMGTPFDYPHKTAYTFNETELVKAGLLTNSQIENRKLLRRVMLLSGFIPNRYEWWHFTSVYRKDVVYSHPFVHSFDSISLPLHKK